MVDALVSGTSGESREGSSPFLGTTTPYKINSLTVTLTVSPTLRPTPKLRHAEFNARTVAKGAEGVNVVAFKRPA